LGFFCIGKMEESKFRTEKIWKIWKKCKLNSEKIWEICKKRRLNSEKRYGKYKRKVS
jgi:hypothetical protein